MGVENVDRNFSRLLYVAFLQRPVSPPDLSAAKRKETAG